MFSIREVFHLLLAYNCCPVVSGAPQTMELPETMDIVSFWSTGFTLMHTDVLEQELFCYFLKYN